ncbi:MAG: hypothetical protein HY069_05025 [Chlamydiia bacterium]|nr:hypothetical protein [Chlamydiia bacterium]
MPKKVLIITSSGGGGLLQTANAKEQEIREADPTAIIIKKDILKDWFGGFFGHLFAEFWNVGQRTGHVWILKLILHVFHPIFDYTCWPFVFFRALSTFFHEDVDRIIDTQPCGTFPILHALQIFNKRRKKTVCVEKVLVDLPTAKATHFFRSIKRLSPGCRQWIRVVTIPPLLEKGETAQEFWLKHCRLTEESIQYEEPYVRTAFRRVKGKPRSDKPISLMVRYKSEPELAWMKKIFGRSSIEAHIQPGEIHFKILPKDRVITVLLGSQPAAKATLNYAKRFSELAQNQNLSGNTHLFLFREPYIEGESSFLTQMAEWLDTIHPYPAHFSLIPFGFQSDDVIASLFHRSDLTCTRSGGQTAMELLSVSTGEMWIHSETKGNEEFSDEQLLKGIPGWEAASAVYLQRVRNAKIVTPEIFTPFAEQFLEAKAALGSYTSRRRAPANFG